MPSKISYSGRMISVNGRPTRYARMISHAEIESRQGTCLRARVGCVIEKDGRIISTGYNGSPPGEPHCVDVGCLVEDGHCIRTTHAEANAIAFAAKHGISTAGATIYVFGGRPICHTCLKLAKSAGIVEFEEVLGEYDSDGLQIR